MARKEIIIHGVQFFIVTNGQLAQGRFIECKTPEEACKLAADRVRLGYAVGAAAFVRRVRDTDYDDGSEPITLATFGRVPPGVADQLPF